MKALVSRFAKCESGATAIEYALLAALIAVALITSMQTLQGAISGTFTNAGNAM
ncbi:MAG: Flp family type IVb pilin [Hyphomicrobiaceae bacterium]